jgi:hypothetical protein
LASGTLSKIPAAVRHNSGPSKARYLDQSNGEISFLLKYLYVCTGLVKILLMVFTYFENVLTVWKVGGGGGDIAHPIKQAMHYRVLVKEVL